MSDDRNRPGTTPQSEADRQARLAREAAALRENLRRRKSQVRIRDDNGAAVDDPGPVDTPARRGASP